MKKLIIFVALALLSYWAISAFALEGCCCEPTFFTGTFEFDTADCPEGFLTTDIPPLGIECTDFCNATYGTGTLPPPEEIDCSSPTYNPAPGIVGITPVKGKKQLTIAFLLPCDAYSVNISRCKGDDCTEFEPVAEIAPTTIYTDTSDDLEWNTDYTYEVVANYLNSGASDPAIANGNPGDLECWNQFTDNQFCIGSFYYENFRDYLQTFGYIDTTPDLFNDFTNTVNSIFNSKFNKGWSCDAINQLVPSGINCASNQLCVADENGASCIAPSPCPKANPFDLYSTAAVCEATPFCYFDKSKTVVDGCFACSQKMSCIDYRSEGACERDPCRAGACEWRDVFPDIGIGTCVDTRFNNCKWCVKNGTDGMENSAAYNEVFDQCNPKKAEALSLPENPCNYNVNTGEAAGCDATACMDYSELKCMAPAEGIALNPDNTLLRSSGDECSIQVCDLSGEDTSCAKNSDGDGEPDCDPRAADYRKCELDYFAPDTSFVISTHELGRMDWMHIKMLDKFNKTHEGKYMQGETDYLLKVCVVGDGDCDNAANFKSSDRERLNFNDLRLQSGTEVVGNLKVGENTLRFFSVDRYQNPEIIDEVKIIACDNCQGPKLLEAIVNPGREVNGKWYTISDLPVITVFLNELSTLTSATLMQDEKVIPVSVNPGSGAHHDFNFVPLNNLDDGEYRLIFNAKDSNGRAMDFPGEVRFVVDTTPGNVIIIPEDGVVLNETSVDVTFIFEEDLTILEAYVAEEIWTSPYAAKLDKIDLIPELTEAGTFTYTASLSGLVGGKKRIYIEAEDFAGNPTIGKSNFWVNTGGLQMRMSEPSWGVSATYTFDIEIDTTRIADCRYMYDTPVAPPEDTFDFMVPFASSTGVTHSIPDFDKISQGDTRAHPFHVTCIQDGTTVQESFELRVDTTPPKILSAFAQPEVIVERRVPLQDIFSTWIKAQTDDEGFCRYSEEDKPFVLMENDFAGFDVSPKQSHSGEVNVTQDLTSYTRYVACKNTAERPSETVKIDFSVDLSVPFTVESKTSEYSNSTDFPISVETNKRAFCFIGEEKEAVVTPMGEYIYGYAHTHLIEVEESGSYIWYVKCSTGASGESMQIEIPVTIDTTPPVMLYVDDSSNLEEEPEFSYFLNQLQVSYLGDENETSISHYDYKVSTFLADVIVKNWTQSTLLDGSAHWVTELNLTDGNKYKIEAYATNIIGLQSEIMASDGVTIDIEKAPEHCQNEVKDRDETDIDCGGECAGCLDGHECGENSDCVSNFCSEGICATAACDDLVKNGAETDIDCGGEDCLPCADEKSCIEGSDCVSGSCNFGTCGPPEECSDGILTGTESDVDCGGTCPARCGEGQNCISTEDCVEGLDCVENTCSSELDSDGDGVPDQDDDCPNTPSSEIADENGCSESQRFTCGDIINDAWRVRYFGSVICDGDAAADADPDDDGLTNEQEFRHRTDPTNPDSDYDGWDDGDEVAKGTDPLNPESHPPSKFKTFLWILLWLLILAALAVGGYMGYQYYLEKQAPPPKPAEAPKKPEKKARVWPEIFENLRKIARKEEPGIYDKDWVSLSALAERVKKEKVHMHKQTFDKLQDLISGKISKKKAPEVLKEIKKEPEAFKLLRKISFEKLSKEEKSELREKLKQLREGVLTPAELEEILAKLRITAAYFKKHKKKLEKELEELLKGK